jgi:hypothetical protein
MSSAENKIQSKEQQHKITARQNFLFYFILRFHFGSAFYSYAVKLWALLNFANDIDLLEIAKAQRIIYIMGILRRKKI